MQYRAYFVGNMYLSSIQQGIQAAHVLGEMVSKYNTQSGLAHWILKMWATEHKTIICLNGGNSSAITQAYELFKEAGEDRAYPFAIFREDRDSLNGATTCAGIIIPASVYDMSPALSENPYNNSADKRLYEYLSSLSLAR